MRFDRGTYNSQCNTLTCCATLPKSLPVSPLKSKSWVTLSKNAPGSIKCSYFEHAIISTTLKKCKWLKNYVLAVLMIMSSKFWSIFLVVFLVCCNEISSWKNCCCFRKSWHTVCLINKGLLFSKKWWFVTVICLIWKLMEHHRS